MGKSKNYGYEVLKVRVPLNMLNDFLGVIDKSGIEILESNLSLDVGNAKRHQKRHVFLSPASKLEIAKVTKRDPETRRKLCEKYNVSKATIGRIWLDNPVKN